MTRLRPGRVAPGTGLDAWAASSCWPPGVAVIDPAADPSQMLNVPTVAVGPDGMVLPTAGGAERRQESSSVVCSRAETGLADLPQ